jgi:hypothetical protein
MPRIAAEAVQIVVELASELVLLYRGDARELPRSDTARPPRLVPRWL